MFVLRFQNIRKQTADIGKGSVSLSHAQFNETWISAGDEERAHAQSLQHARRRGARRTAQSDHPGTKRKLLRAPSLSLPPPRLRDSRRLSGTAEAAGPLGLGQVGPEPRFRHLPY